MRNTYVLAVLIAGLAVSCNKENVFSSDNQGTMKLSAAAGQVSKTELCGCLDIQWLAGDKISVWENGNALNSNIPFSLTSSSEGKTVGEFTGSLVPSSSDFTLYSVYPYKDSYGDNPTSVTLSIPTEMNQCEDINDLVGKTDFMIGQCSSSEYDPESGAYRMLFCHPLTFIRIHIDGRDCVYREATIKKLTMTADIAFVGDVKVNLETGAVVSAASGNEGKSLVVNFPSTAIMGDAQDAWIAINPVDLTDANCHFILEMTNGQKVDFKVNPKSMAPQSLYKFDFSDIDKKIADGKGTPTYVDLLSFTGGKRGNCYIVSEGGYYRFAAQHVDKTNCFEGDKPATDGYKADWLWATGTESKVSGVNLGNSGNINFRVAANANGNSILALYNPSGEIVWSWHIWCTTEDPTTPTHYGRNNSWLMIDRNLGAFSNKEADVNSYGLVYQWGRKDPFPGPKTVGSNVAVKESAAWGDNTQAYVFNSTAPAAAKAFSSTRNSNTSSKGDVAYSIAHPTTNIHAYANTGTTGKEGTWFYTTPLADAILLWNSTGTANGKTNYDPCPAGYYVPLTNEYAWHTLWTNNISWESNTSLSGVVFKENDSNKSYYPAVGYREAGQMKNVGYSCYYWAANAIEDGTRLSAYSLGNSGRTKFANGQKAQTAWALPVRCMKMSN